MFKYGIDKLTVDKAVAISKGNLEAKLTEQAIAKVRQLQTKLFME